MLLAGDLGATKTLLGLFDLVDGRPTAVEVRRYETHAFASGTALLDQFWQDIGRGAPVAAAGFGVAGPVVGDTVRLTNVPWTATVAELQAACLGAPVAVVNDVAAIAHSLDVLDAGDLVTLQPGHRIPLAPVSILARSEEHTSELQSH